MLRLFASHLVLASLLLTASTLFAQRAPAKSDIVSYIHSAWDTLTRDPISCEALVDPKLPAGKSVLYFPAEVQPTTQARAAAEKCKVRTEHLPEKITSAGTFDVNQLKRHGLLYLPNKYVVPGGRFNEMYGWDSYFIIVGLLEDHRIELAKGMVDNFVFEIEHYGALLNANRTYYLTRSQPPFFTSMALAVYNADKEHRFTDKRWLQRVYSAAQKDYEMWTTGEHRAGDTGFSRYYDYGEGPVPEEAHDGYQYYKDAAENLIALDRPNFYFTAAKPGDLVVGELPEHSLGGFRLSGPVAFSSEFYKGDRALRESGFDITNRFGSYGVETHYFAPICLNSLLYRMEMDLLEIANILGKRAEGEGWEKAANRRKNAINSTFWNGQIYSDYQFTNKSGYRLNPKHLSHYPYATTFYPLAFGIAEKSQAEALVSHLEIFARPGGIQTSSNQTGLQWDAPYGWAPLQMIAIDGLRRNGFNQQADAIAKSWLTLVADEYRRTGTIREKYDVVHRTSDVSVTAGYKDNVVGFGWTNGVFLHLLHQLSAADQQEILKAPQAKSATAH
jgi:alpha,alpha-trehalase